MNQVSDYLNILEESLTKKTAILQALLEASKRQSELAGEEDFDLNAFEETMDQKEALLQQLEELDEGFDSVFQKIEAEVKVNKDTYKDSIQVLQQLIRKCTDLGVEIQATEERNRTKLAMKFADQQREIREVKTSSKVATTYYKSMSGKHSDDSYFMDQKK